MRTGGTGVFQLFQLQGDLRIRGAKDKEEEEEED